MVEVKGREKCFADKRTGHNMTRKHAVSLTMLKDINIANIDFRRNAQHQTETEKTKNVGQCPT